MSEFRRLVAGFVIEGTRAVGESIVFRMQYTIENVTRILLILRITQIRPTITPATQRTRPIVAFLTLASSDLCIRNSVPNAATIELPLQEMPS